MLQCLVKVVWKYCKDGVSRRRRQISSCSDFKQVPKLICCRISLSSLFLSLPPLSLLSFSLSLSLSLSFSFLNVRKIQHATTYAPTRENHTVYDHCKAKCLSYWLNLKRLSLARFLTCSSFNVWRRPWCRCRSALLYRHRYAAARSNFQVSYNMVSHNHCSISCYCFRDDQAKSMRRLYFRSLLD